jgi:hypothetical protein
MTDNKNNGLITKIWGPSAWEFFHSVTFGYPLKPTDEQKKQYKDFFTSTGFVLPCKYCRDSYTEFIKSDKDAKLRDEDLEDRESLTKWGYRIHERVNKKLGLTYNISYEDMCDKFESYRAKCMPNEKGCNMPLNLKANSFQKSEIKHAPVITSERYHGFKKYAELRGVKFDDRILNILKLERNDKIWLLRDKKCRQIINKMRTHGIPQVEKEGKYKNMPTVEELNLIKLLCSDICCEELDIIIKNINDILEFSAVELNGNSRVISLV